MILGESSLLNTLCEKDPGLLQSLAKLHTPPRGGPTERRKIFDYITRASLTRLSDGVEKEFSKNAKKKYDSYMKSLFSKCEPTPDYCWDAILEDGNLKLGVFEQLWARIKKASTPGFGFSEYASNEDVGASLAYSIFNEMLLKWKEVDVTELRAKRKTMSARAFKVYLFTQGLAPPATVFVKSECTSKEKIARLIYGCSILLNLMGILLFGDLLSTLADTWPEQQHKVGMDFNTDEGLVKLTKSFDRVIQAWYRAKDAYLISDDIQGWEYQVRETMCVSFHKAFRTNNLARKVKDAVMRHHLSEVYEIIVTNLLVVDSECYFHDLPFYIRFSGEKTTHIQNTFERLCLAYVDSKLDMNLFDADANGDDNVGVTRDLNFEISTKLGFVHTDCIAQTPLKINFCSQQFTRETENEPFKRSPDGLSKMLYNYLSSSEDMMGNESRAGIEDNLDYATVEEFRKLYNRVKDVANNPLPRKILQCSLDADEVSHQLASKEMARNRKSRSGKRAIVGTGDYTISGADSVAKAIHDVDKRLNRIESTTKGTAKTLQGQAAGALGRIAGNFLGGQGDLGEKAAQGVAKWFGYGDYSLSKNSLIMPEAADVNGLKFSSDGKRGIRIREREFLGDIVSGPLSSGSSVFTNETYVINPGDSKTFPWLSKIATNFDQWKPNGIIFEFKSTSSTFNGASQALGVVVAATDYDVLDLPFANKIEMETADYSNSCKASNDMVHGIECEAKERPDSVFFVRHGVLPNNDNARFYDLGNFQLATRGMSTADTVLGELWVTYDITFYKKQLNPLPYLETFQALSDSSTNASMMPSPYLAGSLPMTVVSGSKQATLFFPEEMTKGTFLINFVGNWGGGVFSYGLTNCAIPTTYGQGSPSVLVYMGPQGGWIYVAVNARNASILIANDAASWGTSNFIATVTKVEDTLPLIE